MSLSRYSLFLAAGVVVVFGTVIALHWPRDAQSEPSVMAAPAPTAAKEAPSTQPVAAPVAAPEPGTPPERKVARQADKPERTESAYEARLRAATDYLEFARDMLGRARDGDQDAQYHLYAALDYCRRGYRDHFDRGQQRLSLDEALRAEGDSPASREIRQVYSRCGNLMSLTTGEFGEAEQWLQRSARSGHPRAQVQLASRLISGSRTLAPAQASRSLTEARQFVHQSLASRDPEVIWAAATLPDISADAGARDRTETMAWWQAACDQGLDCGPGSDHVRQLCREVPDCQPFESVNDILVRTARNPSAVTERAKQINASLAAGDFGALGL